MEILLHVTSDKFWNVKSFFRTLNGIPGNNLSDIKTKSFIEHYFFKPRF